MNNCEINTSLVPLSRIVAAALVDTYGDTGKMEQRFYHWAARGLRKLSRDLLKMSKKRGLLTVNQNTWTASLPPDFYSESFIGVVNDYGIKVPLRLRGDLAITPSLADKLDGQNNPCNTCGQNKAICEDMQITEEVNFITINSQPYQQTIIKRLQPNGDYYLEKTTPVFDYTTNGVAYNKTTEFITNFDLKQCGCLETTPDNMSKLQDNCPETYSFYYSECDCATADLGGYRILEDIGLIQFQAGFPFTKVYIEYNGFLPKFNGQYYVPEVAFETLVEWVKYKSVQNRTGNFNRFEVDRYLSSYMREKAMLARELRKISLSTILQVATSIPKFDLYGTRDWYSVFSDNRRLLKKATEPQIVNQTFLPVHTRTAEATIAYKKIQFTVGGASDPDTGTNMTSGQSVLTITDANIKADSVNIVLGTATLHEGLEDEISYTVAYNPNNIVITFNQAVQNTQKYVISYVKAT